MQPEPAITGRQERAAMLLAEDRQSDDEIAAAIGVNRVTLHRWKRDAAFAARIDAIRAETAAAVLAEGIANRQNRVRVLDDLWQRAQTVIASRAADPTMAAVPGGSTGMLLRTYKSIGTGPTATMVEEYAWDRSIEASVVNLQVTAAKETGQWVEKREQSGEMIVREYVGISLDDV